MTYQKGDWEKDFEEAVKLHQKAIDGDQQAAKKAYDILKKIKLQAMNYSIVEAYFGSSSALIARDHPDLIEKMNLAKRGLKALDKAVKAEPNHTEIRILRANVAYRLPEMYFKRTKTAIEDFQFLISDYEKKKTDISKDQYCEFLLNLGSSYQTIGDSENAENTWEKLLKINSGKYKKLVEQARKTGGE
ncbi:lipopolysaccharide assembly protein LapB [Bacillus sp. AFS040349]|uniref:tetratricopeptide repeat protein n=1 Tax=Bacillus sp. AFS040349 TaxID=2033502 RepID=UPI000BFC4F94|nr:hypothetical protein [Bacillus sp. AFS040349]PGT78948.1 hypothetical protein COD11_23365 [Bacillus sp. AFS040349]